MQERQVTIGRETHPLPDPFLVMATQNPIESDGTYPLPEAQVDRFMLKVLVDYPSPTEEFVIVERMIAGLEDVHEVMDVQQLRALQKAVQTVFVDPALIEYAVRVASATRDPSAVGLPDLARYVTYGVSPRASIYMVMAAQALALVRGRQYVLPEDVRAMAPDVLRHRLVLSYEALGDDVSAEQVVDAILRRVPVPDVVLRDAERASAAPSDAASRDCGLRPPPDPRTGPAPSRVAGRPAPRRAPAGRLPHAAARATAPTSSTCAPTSGATTSATSTGTSPPGWTSCS